jgi:S-adenosylmethionine:tRNA ribosyltransferase-isomerase
MIAADHPIQRPHTAKLLTVDHEGRFAHIARDHFADLLRPSDLVVANDAATLPASLHGVHERTGDAIEVRLAGWRGGAAGDVAHFDAIVFGAGDYHTRTEHRAPPPMLAPGDRLSLGPLSATVVTTLGHPRLVSLEFDGTADEIWAGLARHGRPIQYAHIAEPLALWDVWTVVAGPPVAFEPPSAGFVLSWATIERLHQRGVSFATITLASGISSTGDDELDRRLPLAEPYRIPEATAIAIASARAEGRRIVAIGTSVVRALEHAAERDGIVRGGEGIATNRIGSSSHLSVVDAILTGTHEPGTSHHDLLTAFVNPETLRRIDAELDAHEYRTHEFGDSLFIERANERHTLKGVPYRSDVSAASTNVSVGDAL